MKKLLSVIAALTVMGISGIAFAVTYSFEDMKDIWNGFDSVRITQQSPLNYTHNINGQVNFAAGDKVTYATLELDFTNDSDLLDFRGFWFDGREFSKFGYDGSGWVQLGEVDNGQYSRMLNIDWLNDNGMMDVTVKVWNDLGTATAWLDHSRLYGTAEAAPVPEPGTILLFGAGLLGLAVFGKRRMNRS